MKQIIRLKSLLLVVTLSFESEDALVSPGVLSKDGTFVFEEISIPFLLLVLLQNVVDELVFFVVITFARCNIHIHGQSQTTLRERSFDLVECQSRQKQ